MNKRYKGQHPPRFLLQEKLRSHVACPPQPVLCISCFLSMFWVAVVLRFHVVIDLLS